MLKVKKSKYFAEGKTIFQLILKHLNNSNSKFPKYKKLLSSSLSFFNNVFMPFHRSKEG